MPSTIDKLKAQLQKLEAARKEINAKIKRNSQEKNSDMKKLVRILSRFLNPIQPVVILRK